MYDNTIDKSRASAVSPDRQRRRAGRFRPPKWPTTGVTARQLTLAATRISLGVVFVWFGALKLTGSTPVAALVAGTVPWIDPMWLVPALGAVEVGLGLALIAGRWVGAISSLVALHLTGTLLVLVMQPQVAFQHGNPLLLTTAGEFVIKNLVFISAAMVLATHAPTRSTARKAYELAA